MIHQEKKSGGEELHEILFIQFLPTDYLFFFLVSARIKFNEIYCVFQQTSRQEVITSKRCLSSSRNRETSGYDAYSIR